MTDQTEQIKVRLDKWLWAARFYKTRNLAKDAIDGGKVHYNGARVKPSKMVDLNATIRLRTGYDEKTIEIIELFDKRRAAPLAQGMYKETQDSINKREAEAAMRKQIKGSLISPETKPTKKQRRDIMTAKNAFYE